MSEVDRRAKNDRLDAFYEPDLAGNVVRQRTETGSVIVEDFDPMGRPVRRVVENGQTRWSTVQSMEYDGLGRMTLALDNNDVLDPGDDSNGTREHDSLGRVVQERQNGRVVVWSYTGVGEAMTVRYPSLREVETQYDSIGRATTLSDAGALYSYEYDGPRLHARDPAAGAAQVYEHDDAGRVLSLQESHQVRFYHDHERMGRRTETLLRMGDDIFAQEHEYVPLGRLVGLDRTVHVPTGPALSVWRTNDCTLDGANDWGLVAATRPGVIHSESRIHDAAHAIVSTTASGVTTNHAFDAAGNVLDDGAIHLEWDAYNRLRTATDAATGNLVATYDYDALDRRTEKIVTNRVPWMA